MKDTLQIPLLLLLVAFVSFATPAAAQSISWRQLQMPRRFEIGMVYDPSRGESLIFGGSIGLHGNNEVPTGELWAWNGSFLALRANTPSIARFNHAMAFDTARCEALASGGFQSTFVHELWVWNGTGWVLRTLSGADDQAAMAFDSGRGVTVLFGGWVNGGAATGYTSEWNGTTWVGRSGTSPSPRFSHAMAYDARRGVTVLFGGAVRSSSGLSHDLFNDTWEWNGTVWTQRNVPGPSARSGHVMAFDLVRGVTVLFGGYTDTATDRQVWEWDGISWSQRPPTDPTPGGVVGMTFDSLRGVSVAYDGYSGIWEWNGSTWSNRTPPTMYGRYAHALAYDSARDRAVAFGGYTPNPFGTGNGPNGETWEWDGAQWSLVTASGPSARYYHAMVYDAARGEAILFGGLASVSNGDTWKWNGSAWTQALVAGPSPRYGHAMAYDSSRQAVVLFGGRGTGAGASSSGDTWEWNGAEWTLRSTAGPAPRYLHAMAFDSVRSRTVLFGGAAGSLNGETWEWDGTSWTQRAATGPSPRYGHSMTYDAARGRVVLFGDASDAFAWDWDGSTWTQRPEVGPVARVSSAMAYDSTRSVALLSCGSQSGSTPNDDLWALGAPCGTPILTAQPASRAACNTGSSGFSVAATSTGAISYQWQARSASGRWQQLADHAAAPPCGTFSSPLAYATPLNSPAPTIGIRAVVGNPTAPQHIQVRCLVSNACGTTTSNEATYTICPADFNCSGGLEVQDIFDFLNAWLAADPAANFNGVTGITVQDIFDFLNAWLAAC